MHINEVSKRLYPRICCNPNFGPIFLVNHSGLSAGKYGSSEFIVMSVFSGKSSQGFPVTSTRCVAILVELTVGVTCAGCFQEPDFGHCGLGAESTSVYLQKALRV